jgi:phage baseplate assembly protein W
MDTDQKFIGTGWGFPPTFRKTDRVVEMVSGKDDIEQSLAILLSTHIGERIMQPRYGCNLDKLIFEPLDSTLIAYVKELIETAILYFEPRITVNEITLEPVNNEGKLEISIVYTIAVSNKRFNYVYPFYKTEGSEGTKLS